jgi:hypothetical protein
VGCKTNTMSVVVFCGVDLLDRKEPSIDTLAQQGCSGGLLLSEQTVSALNHTQHKSFGQFSAFLSSLNQPYLCADEVKAEQLTLNGKFHNLLPSNVKIFVNLIFVDSSSSESEQMKEIVSHILKDVKNVQSVRCLNASNVLSVSEKFEAGSISIWGVFGFTGDSDAMVSRTCAGLVDSFNKSSPEGYICVVSAKSGDLSKEKSLSSRFLSSRMERIEHMMKTQEDEKKNNSRLLRILPVQSHGYSHEALTSSDKFCIAYTEHQRNRVRRDLVNAFSQVEILNHSQNHIILPEALWAQIAFLSNNNMPKYGA